MLKHTVALIGCGASGVAILHQLAAQLNNISEKPTITELSIFEPAQDLGVGLAYQKDLDALLINRPANSMSIDSDCQKDYESWLTENDIANEGKSDPYNGKRSRNYTCFTSRQQFGDYLKSRMKSALDCIRQHGIQVQIYHKAIIKIMRTKRKSISRFILYDPNCNYHAADDVILAIGNNKPLDTYHLSHTDNYIHEPYPTQQKLKIIPSSDKICIVGNSLTAVDMALALNALGHRGRIMLSSRTHIFPHVRKSTSSHHLKYLTHSNIDKLIHTQGSLTLRNLVRLLRLELKYSCESQWQTLFRSDKTDLVEHLDNELSMENAHPYQSLLNATNNIIEKVWHNLRFKDKKLFLSRYHRLWNRCRFPIPKENAKQLLNMAKNNQLHYFGNLKTIHYDATNKLYELISTDKSKAQIHWVINATGPAHHLPPDNLLLHTLITCGHSRLHPLGGIDVDYNTNLLISSAGSLIQGLYLLGHNSFGTFYHVSSLEMLVNKAATIIKHILLNSQKRRHYVQLDTDTNIFSRPRRPT